MYASLPLHIAQPSLPGAGGNDFCCARTLALTGGSRSLALVRVRACVRVRVCADDGQNCFDVGSFKPGHGDGFYNNSCIILGCRSPGCVDKVTSVSQCDPTIVTLKNNKYYTTHGNATIACGNKGGLSVAEAQAVGMELGSTAAKLPSDDEIVAMAKAVLTKWG